MWYAYSVFLVALLKEFGWSRSLLAGALVLNGFVSRPWHLYVTFGILTGLGVAMAGWVPAVIIVQRWFPRRVGTTLGFTSDGVGIFLVVPVCQYFINLVGWRTAFHVARARDRHNARRSPGFRETSRTLMTSDFAWFGAFAVWYWSC